MQVCKVIGKVISTQKDERLVGYSIVLVQAVSLSGKGKAAADPQLFAAVDTVGCGEGNLVLVTAGSGARFAVRDANAPVDMAVVGMIDSGVGEV